MKKFAHEGSFGEPLENHKRRNALPPAGGVSYAGLKLFFNRVLAHRRTEDLIFIERMKARAR